MLADRYCITHVNHDHTDDHTASSFILWKEFYNDDYERKWKLLGEREAAYVVELVSSGHIIITGEIAENIVGNKYMDEGDEIEVVLRVNHNGGKHSISSLPSFPPNASKIVGAQE